MAENITKGVIIEFDFAAMDGAQLLFDVAKKFLANLDGIPFDARIEAQYLAGGNYQGGLADYFAVVKTKKTAAKAAKDLAEAFGAALKTAVPAAVTPAFGNFVSAIASKGVKVVIATRADVSKVEPAFAGLLGENVALYQEPSSTYGSVKWDAWRRACAQNKLRNTMTLAVTGSGYGVKSALLAGMGAVAVEWPHVAYQDFGGADEVLRELSGKTAKTVLEVLRV
ncbi:MAG: hypothetical protein IJ829_01300 [Kiritimatiellae bacterium]|nr:hypothetical protein [Kiritimatiellia bacterium]